MTIVMAEGRRMMRLSRELPRDRFERLLETFQRALIDVFSELGGGDVTASGDTVTAAFASAREAALAAAEAHEAVAAREWPGWPRPGVSVGIASDVSRCEALCDAAEGGQTFVSPETASELEGEDLGGLLLSHAGRRRTRRSNVSADAYELV